MKISRIGCLGLVGLACVVGSLSGLVAGYWGARLAAEPTPESPRSLIKTLREDEQAEARHAAALPPPTVAPSGMSAAEQTAVEVFRRNAPSVVFITTLAVQRSYFRQNATAVPRGSGTGFIWDKEGHVVTNFHVLEGSAGARVTLSDGSSYAAKLVGTFDDKDLAVLRIDAPKEKLHPVTPGTSAKLEVGQAVFAIGNPFGLDHTLSAGVVSAVGREIRAVGGEPIQGVIQTDAAINPGNSGGPLLDSRGHVIGVNTQILSPSGASSGVGFAVPIDTVRRVVPQLISHGRIIRPVLGVELDEGRFSAQAGLGGVMVLGVNAGSGAERAGIRGARMDMRTGTVIVGDVIVSIDGKAIRSADDVYRALDTRQPGETVTVEVENNRKRRSVKVTLSGVVDR